MTQDITSKYAWRGGYCDAIFCRECKSPFPDFVRSRAYLSGYIAGQELGVRYDMANRGAEAVQ